MILKLLSTVLVFAGIWLGGAVAFSEQIPAVSPPQAELAKVDAIIVLTGGKNRLETGVQLLQAGIAEKMLVTGVGKDVADIELLERMHLKIDLANKISLGREAVDTFGNVEETKKWLVKNNVRSFVLVTANYHMPRALWLFERSLPEIAIVPYAFNPPDFKRKHWFFDRNSRKIIFSEYNKFLLSF